MKGSAAGRPIPQLTEADEKRFWSKVALPDPDTGCMNWLAGKFIEGYGSFWLKGAAYRAHRIAWALANGEIPPGKVLDHLCRNTSCVAPGHLEVVDQRENVLRGESFAAENAKRTRCPQGHEYTAENTYVYPPDKRNPNGRRDCRTCRRERLRAYHQRKRLTSADSTGQLPMPPTPHTGLDAS